MMRAWLLVAVSGCLALLPLVLAAQPVTVPPSEAAEASDGDDSAPGEPEAAAPDAPVSAVPPSGKITQNSEDEAQERGTPKAQFFSAVLLQGHNKVTAKVTAIEAPVGSVVRWGNLEIIARRCWQAAPDERPENAALLEIRELKPNEEPKRVFLGWMFSSSPALSALEHPVYDLAVTRCGAASIEDENTAKHP